MKAIIKQHLFTQVSMDSGVLTLLGTVIHPFAEPGAYYGTVLLGKSAVANFHLSVDEQSQATQVHIDLTDLHLPITIASREDVFVVGPKGYAVFHVLSGSGSYAVLVSKMG